MLKIAKLIDERALPEFSATTAIENVDVFVSPRLGLMGIALSEEFLVVNVNNSSSFRIRPNNLGFIKHCYAIKGPITINREYLENYFFENEDNPYAIQHVMNLYMEIAKGIRKNDVLEKAITQYPPLNKRKSKIEFETAMQKMIDKMEPFDSIFSYNRGSGLHRLIRKISKGYWAHCGVAGKSKKILEMTLSGTQYSIIGGFNENWDVALYRLKDISIEEHVINEMEKYNKEAVEKFPHYGWSMAIGYYLKKQYRLPIPKAFSGISPSDIVYGNFFELIAYA